MGTCEHTLCVSQAFTPRFTHRHGLTSTVHQVLCWCWVPRASQTELGPSMVRNALGSGGGVVWTSLDRDIHRVHILSRVTQQYGRPGVLRLTSLI